MIVHGKNEAGVFEAKALSHLVKPGGARQVALNVEANHWREAIEQAISLLRWYRCPVEQSPPPQFLKLLSNRLPLGGIVRLLTKDSKGRLKEKGRPEDTQVAQEQAQGIGEQLDAGLDAGIQRALAVINVFVLILGLDQLVLVQADKRGDARPLSCSIALPARGRYPESAAPHIAGIL